MAPSVTTKAARAARRKPPTPDAGSALFRFEQVVAARDDAEQAAAAGPSTAAVTAAINAGRRPSGPAYVERTDRNERDRTVLVVWAVPTVDGDQRVPAPFAPER